MQEQPDRENREVSEEEPEPLRVCFVCTGNICRSPMADAVFRELVARAGLDGLVEVSSAGTSGSHDGEPAHPRALTALQARGYDGSAHISRRFTAEDYERHDLILALDSSHLRTLRDSAPSEQARRRIQLLLGAGRGVEGSREVPDPYYSDQDEYHRVLATIEAACELLLRELEPALRPTESTR